MFFWLGKGNKEASLESSSFICVRMGIDRIGKWLLITIQRLSYIIFCGRLEKSVCYIGDCKKTHREEDTRVFKKREENII